ncbi:MULTISPECIES: hypothetical protein [unclassified Streptomyces]|uniref:hypothetical protein n=1 Tax=unclassified Streptomyces TaxID=2593676 RepID=UPI000B2B4821|nr:hypothetical protein [Streptomyces sp. NRRL F-5630]
MTHALVAGDAPERTPGADDPAARALLDAGLTRFARYGATADRALTEHDEHAEHALASGARGVGVTGGGLREPELLPRFQTAAHLARPQTPQTAITFTTSGALEARGPHRPGDSRQAASRHLPGITAPDNGGSDAAGSDVTGSDVPWPDVVGVAIAAPEVAAPDAAGRERASR